MGETHDEIDKEQKYSLLLCVMHIKTYLSSMNMNGSMIIKNHQPCHLVIYWTYQNYLQNKREE